VVCVLYDCTSRAVALWCEARTPDVRFRSEPNPRGWIKTKNPNYWRLDLEREPMAPSRERRDRRELLGA